MYHKINSLPIEVCSAEQKVAYSLLTNFQKCYKTRWKDATAKNSIARIRSAAEIMAIAVNFISDAPNVYKNKYDVEEVMKLVYINLYYFMDNPVECSTYEEIGNAVKKSAE